MASSQPTYVGLDREVIVLAATTELVDTLVNHAIFDLLGEHGHRQPMPHTSTHQEFFAASLVDFLSSTDPDCGVGQHPYLEHLTRVCETPSLGDARELGDLVAKLREWLRTRIKIERVWLASLDIETTLTPTRVEWLRTCGDLSKHNVLRSGRTAKTTKGWLKDHGHDVDIHRVLVALPDIQYWLNDDLLSRQIVVIAQRLNALRWSIYDYVKPYYDRAYLPCADGRYTYSQPPELSDGFPRTCHWNLLNWVRKRPLMQRFTVDPIFEK
jgi:hypothetical protein